MVEFIGRLVSFGIFAIWPTILLGQNYGFPIGLAFFSVMAALFSIYHVLHEIRQELMRSRIPTSVA